MFTNRLAADFINAVPSRMFLQSADSLCLLYCMLYYAVNTRSSQ